MTETAVRLEQDGDVAVIIIDNPPINAGSLAVRAGLLKAVERVERDAGIVAAVLIGAGGTFIAGSDLREFGQPLEAPELPQVIAAIGASAKPFVAALEGAALGGGYELALGCDARIAAPGTVVGLPEVTLGIIPGAGGTQRLPRLVGVARAISLICAGTRVPADEAAQLGMIDEVADGDLRQAAVAHARTLSGAKRRVADMVPSHDPADASEAAAAQALKAGRNRPQVAEAIAAIRSALDRPFEEALAAERAVFTRLRLGREAAALRHLFFAERKAGRPPRGVAASPLARAGVIGSGTMGTGIAAALLDAGLTVTLVDKDPAALARGSAAVEAILTRWTQSVRLDAVRAAHLRSRFVPAGSLDGLAECDIVIEAIIEDMAAKAGLLADIAALVGPETIIATNTSYLDIEALAQAVPRPERVIGLHFFNPAQVMRLLEVVRPQATSEETLATGLELARRMGKQPVVARPGPGFIGNRIYAAYRRQCEFMIEEGAWPDQVDAALEAFGFAMGPFATGDLSGLDIAWAMRKSQAASRDPTHRYVAIADRLCEAGRLGRKTGAGWYVYAPDARRGAPDDAVRDIIIAESARNGVSRRDFTDPEIVARVLVTMLNEAALVLEEGVAERASDIDVTFVHGYGFPRHEGGPLFWAAGQPDDVLTRSLDAIAVATGPGFKRGGIEAVLAEIRRG